MLNLEDRLTVCRTGFGNHGDYVFGWKGDALQKAMDSNCNINCPQLKTQTIAQGNQCNKGMTVKETIDGCEYCLFFVPIIKMLTQRPGLDALPGGAAVN